MTSITQQFKQQADEYINSFAQGVGVPEEIIALKDFSPPIWPETTHAAVNAGIVATTATVANTATQIAAHRMSAAFSALGFKRLFETGITQPGGMGYWIAPNAEKSQAFLAEHYRHANNAVDLRKLSRHAGIIGTIAGSGHTALHAARDVSEGRYLQAAENVGGFAVSLKAGMACGGVAAKGLSPLLVTGVGTAVHIGGTLLAAGVCASGADKFARTAIHAVGTAASKLYAQVTDTAR